MYDFNSKLIQLNFNKKIIASIFVIILQAFRQKLHHHQGKTTDESSMVPLYSVVLH